MRKPLIAALLLLSACDPGQPILDGGSTACPVATGTGTSHGGATLTTDTTWKAVDNPHIVTFGFIVEKGATLALEPCTEVRIQAGYGITVRGKLKAEGTATTPILITADSATPWSYIQMMNGGSASLAYVTLENGGNLQDPNGLASLEARGIDTDPRQELIKVDHVTIKGSQQFGVSLRNGATFTADSSALTITGAAKGPIRTQPRLVGSIPTGSYTGNTIDEILIMAEEVINQDTTIRDRGVPYRLGFNGSGQDLRVGSSMPNAPKSTLTIEAGVTIRMSPTGRILMSKNNLGTLPVGALVAKGTAAKPIVFTSAAASPAAGDWVGLWFDAPDPANRLEFVEVKYAGGPSFANSAHCAPTGGGFSASEDAAVLLFGKPPSAFITNSKFTSSAGDGIGRSWSDDPLDMLATNTFSQIMNCNQSFPRSVTGTCPAMSPCPK